MLRVPVNVRRALLSRDEDYTSALAGCTVPLAALQGRQDSVVLPRMVERLGTQIDRLVITTLDGVGHVPWLESPAAFEASVRALVTRARLDHGSP
jgi:pimeloyl-ACP methyl ester carboxylesterase